MKKLFALWVVFVLLFSAAFAESIYEQAAALIEQSMSGSFDYCDVQYNASDETLIVNVAIDGFSDRMYAAIEDGSADTKEYWYQGKGVFFMIYQTLVDVIEDADLGIPENAIYFQVLNDDVAIRNDDSSGKSRILWAINCGMFYIDELEAWKYTESSPEPCTIDTLPDALPASTIDTVQENAPATSTQETVTYILNIKSHKFHTPSCDSVERMKESNKCDFYGDRDEAIAQGYEPCGVCNP